MRLNQFVAIGIAALLGLGGNQSAMAEKTQIWGSTTCQKRFLEPGNEALKAATGIDVKVMGVGSGKGLIAVIEGKAPASATSSSLKSTVNAGKKAAKKSGKMLSIPNNLEFHEIASDVIVPIVHKDNPVSSLSWEQLKAINTGTITNWKAVGGHDLPIRVVTSHEGSSTRAVFQKMVMKKAPYIDTAVKVMSTRLEINEVSKYKGAIGAVSEGFIRQNPGKSKLIQTDEISRPLALITVGTPTATVQKVIDFYRSPAGRKQIK